MILKPVFLKKYLLKCIFPFLTLGIILTLFGWIWGLFFAPGDLVQKEHVRYLYLHVPFSWGALSCYFVMGVFSLIGIIKQLPQAHILSHSMGMVGFVLCLLSLLTGSIWGKPTWGAYWVWDARLTSMAVLALLYGGYLSIINAYDSDKKGRQAAAFLCVLGLLNLPLIKWSVTWWSTLHQPASIMKFSKPSVDSAFLMPLLLSAFGLCFLCLSFMMMRAITFLNERREKKQSFKKVS